MLVEPDLLSDPPSNFTVESSLSKELLKLSFEERQAIQEEIHGVGCAATEETSELLKDALLDFDEKLNHRKERAISRPEKDHRNLRKYLRNICRTNSSSPSVPVTTDKRKLNCYLNRSDIRLKFLRHEFFSVDKAIERFVCFLEYCSEIFGDYICEREMVLSDFNREELSALRYSRTQFLPFRDRSGRRVLVAVGNCNFHLPLKLRLKIRMFQQWQVSKDVETQRKGVVVVIWPFDEDKGKDQTWEKVIRPGIGKDAKAYQRRHSAAIPLRVASHQMYYKDTPFFHTLSAMYVYHALKPSSRAVYKAHFGDNIELLYQLGSYGISPDLMPISITRTVKFGHMNAWINYSRECEEQAKHRDEYGLELVECPWIHDVVFRKGSTFRYNLGNVFYRTLIETYSDEHARADKQSKVDITHRIINEIEKRNGRFLEWSTKKYLWVVINDRDKIRRKIAGGLKQYSYRRKKRTDFGGPGGNCSNDASCDKHKETSVLANSTTNSSISTGRDFVHDLQQIEGRSFSFVQEYYSNRQNVRARDASSCFCNPCRF